jgi:signal transduction histidine kinase/ligand-binding sensor domain-containing protein/CheY-like chemotaxis protein
MFLEHLSTLEGLPQGTVTATLQDSQGFVWLGTEDGLVRFDGHDVRRYAYSRTAKAGLPGNFVYAIAEDAQGDLWIAVKGAGLAHWDRKTDRFSTYRHDPANPGSLSSDTVRTVLIDTRGRIWAGTLDAGVNIVDPRSGAIEHLRHDPARADSLIDDEIHAVLQDRSGAIWIGTHNGLDRLQLDSSSAAHVGDAPQTGDSLSGKQISQIIEDNSGSFWVGTFDAGLYNIDRAGRLITAFHHDAARAGSLSSNDVHAILEDRAGHLWVGTSEALDLLNSTARSFTHYRHDKSQSDSLADSFVMSLSLDANGLVWIGTKAGGVDRWNPHSWELGGDRPAWLDGKLVTSFADAPNGRLWIGSMGGGLTQLDTDTDEWTDIDSMVHQPNALGDRRVMSLHQDRHGTLWIGTMSAGLKKLTPDGQIISIPVRRGDAYSLSATGIMAIFESHDGRLWIGTHGGGANILDPATGLVRQLPSGSKDPGAVSADNVTSFAEDSQGNIWIGTDNGGLNLAHADGTVFKVFNHNPEDSTSLSANAVWSIAADSSSGVWIATDGGGLDHVVGSSAAPDAIRFQNTSQADGLSSDTIYGVLIDKAGRLWLSGNAGLMRYDPKTRAVKTFHREHGLQGEEFDFGAYYRTNDGRLCFGGPGGFNIFDPSQLFENSSPPRLALTGLEILGVPVATPTPYWLLKRIELDHRANIVSFDFAALDFTSPNHNRLAYRMAGLTDHWIDLGTQHRVTLTSLDAGDHLLEVRAANADSIWTTKPLLLAIHKAPAPWQSTWAYASYALAAVGLIALALRAQRRKLQRALAAQQRLETEVSLRTHELRDTNRQLLVASEAKSAFLARMSHELRTPMNGVVGMTELLERTPLSETQARHTQTIRSSAQTLLQILNDLLDLSKAQAGKVKLESLPLDLTQLIEECAVLFCGAAEAKGVEIIVCPPKSDGWVLLGDPLRIRQILMNLIGNATKFTERGNIIVKCDISASDAECVHAQISITDSGIGMDAAAMDKIFEPFVQADETTTRRFGGTGLGLSICHELVDLMGGAISVQSEPQIGSTFTISLQLRVHTHPPARQVAAFAGKSASILTRRPALSEALQCYTALLGLDHLSADDDFVLPSPRANHVVIVDADTCARVLASYAARHDAGRCPFVIVASGAAIEEQHLEAMACVQQIVRKPVRRDALREAIESATGTLRQSTRHGASHSASPRSAHAHVLIVEDDSVNAAVAEGYLAELGCTSVWVSNGEEAVARNAVEHFNMILMDLNMPGFDGYETASLIRKGERAGSRIPIVALTANDAKAYREACLRGGMDDILSKPYTFAQCAALLQRWAPSPPRTQDKPRALSSIDAATVAGLRSLRAGRADMYPRLVELFQKTSADALAQLGAALAGHDLGSAKALCHKMKSASANVGALAFAHLLGELERACIAGDGAHAQNIYESLAEAHPDLIDALNEFSLRATG